MGNPENTSETRVVKGSIPVTQSTDWIKQQVSHSSAQCNLGQVHQTWPMLPLLVARPTVTTATQIRWQLNIYFPSVQNGQQNARMMTIWWNF